MKKNYKQLRFDFPDYTADNQERDISRYETRINKEVYIVKIRGNYGAYLPDGDDNIFYENFKAKNLGDFYGVAKSFFNKIGIKPKFHCILNEGIENHILQHIKVQKIIE